MDDKNLKSQIEVQVVDKGAPGGRRSFAVKIKLAEDVPAGFDVLADIGRMQSMRDFLQEMIQQNVELHIREGDEEFLHLVASMKQRA